MKKKYLIAFIVSIFIYFLISKVGFYLAHNLGAALFALLFAPSFLIIFLSLPIPEVAISFLIIVTNMYYYLFLYSIYKKLNKE